MVLRLAAALDLPFREQNGLLLAAGFAPAWRESALGAPELALVERALDYMLIQQEPYPAFVVDRRWQLLRANAAAQRLVRFLTDSPAWKPDPASPVNLADALVAPNALRPCIRNWREVALYFLRSVRADARSISLNRSRPFATRCDASTSSQSSRKRGRVRRSDRTPLGPAKLTRFTRISRNGRSGLVIRIVRWAGSGKTYESLRSRLP